MSPLASEDPSASAPAEASSERIAERRYVRGVRGGDRDSFAPLVDLHQGRLFGLTLMMLRDRQVAEEVTQDAFFRAYTRLHLYDERRAFYPWLATIAVRLAQNRLRRDSRIRSREGTPLEEVREPKGTSAPLDEVIVGERADRLWRAVAQLPYGERTAVFLYYRNDLGIAEIARALGVTGGTVKTMLFRARRKLRLRADIAGEA